MSTLFLARAASVEQLRALSAIVKERERQEQLKRWGEFKHTCADNEMSNGQRLAVLMEEIGEVARVLCEQDTSETPERWEQLRAELTQVAAVCVAWLESDCK